MREGGGGPQCRLSILRNVSCRYFLNVPVNFRTVQCRLSILRRGSDTLSNLREWSSITGRRGQVKFESYKQGEGRGNLKGGGVVVWVLEVLIILEVGGGEGFHPLKGGGV